MESPEHSIELISENKNDGSALYRCNCGCVFCVESVGNAAFVCDEGDDETQG